jgi:hypothetical protein
MRNLPLCVVFTPPCVSQIGFRRTITPITRPNARFKPSIMSALLAEVSAGRLNWTEKLTQPRPRDGEQGSAAKPEHCSRTVSHV